MINYEHWSILCDIYDIIMDDSNDVLNNDMNLLFI